MALEDRLSPMAITEEDVFGERRRSEDEHYHDQEPDEAHAPHHRAHAIHHAIAIHHRFCLSFLAADKYVAWRQKDAGSTQKEKST
jgi:hypothetical protein